MNFTERFKRRILQPLRGAIVLFLLGLNAFVAPTLICLLVWPGWILPTARLRGYFRYCVGWIPVYWADTNALIFKIFGLKTWTAPAVQDLSWRRSYLLMANHQTWLDIMILTSVFAHRTPPYKFFMKRPLLWTLPIVSWACWLLDFPFLHRHSPSDVKKNPQLKGKDIETTIKACRKFRIYPTTAMIFPEGTRFTLAKRDHQRSPFNHLLKPKAMGMAMVLQENHRKLRGIINATITYSEIEPSLWNFACGRIEKTSVKYDLLPITPDLIGNANHDSNFRKHFQQWLMQLWQEKDRLIDFELQNFKLQKRPIKDRLL